jgi:fatty acid-binding protein DegV
MSRVLSVKPIINFIQGQVQLLGVSRSFRRGIKRILDRLEELAPLEQLAVMHARNAEQAEALADQLAERLDFPREQIVIGETGVVVASHAGAGAVGVFAVARPRPQTADAAHS